jgi:intracellular septation protein
MMRYLPPRAIQYVPDLGIAFGYVWAAMMFFSAALNLGLALTCSVEVWGTVMSLWGAGSKIALFLIQFSYMKFTGKRRHRAQMMFA